MTAFVLKRLAGLDAGDLAEVLWKTQDGTEEWLKACVRLPTGANPKNAHCVLEYQCDGAKHEAIFLSDTTLCHLDEDYTEETRWRRPADCTHRCQLAFCTSLLAAVFAIILTISVRPTWTPTASPPTVSADELPPDDILYSDDLSIENNDIYLPEPTTVSSTTMIPRTAIVFLALVIGVFIWTTFKPIRVSPLQLTGPLPRVRDYYLHANSDTGYDAFE